MVERIDLTAIKASEKLPKTLRGYEEFTLFGAWFLALKKEKDKKKYIKTEEVHEKGLKKLLESALGVEDTDEGDERLLRILKQFEAILGNNKGNIFFDETCIRLVIETPCADEKKELFEELGRVKSFKYQSKFHYNFWFVLEVAKRAGKGEWVLKNNKKGYLFLYRDKELVGVVLPRIKND